ncbi:MAG: hypothetical protein Q8O99_01575 [bacterium]|nr:hypothetical protein [bacterium]
MMAYTYAQNDPSAGIILNSNCISDGSCKLQIYKTLLLRQDSGGENTPQTFVQDIFLSATFFIGTMAAFGLVISGMMMVFGGAQESMYEKGKKGVIYSIIGIMLVALSYTIIRIVQYIAQ